LDKSPRTKVNLSVASTAEGPGLGDAGKSWKIKKGSSQGPRSLLRRQMGLNESEGMEREVKKDRLKSKAERGGGGFSGDDA